MVLLMPDATAVIANGNCLVSLWGSCDASGDISVVFLAFVVCVLVLYVGLLVFMTAVMNPDGAFRKSPLCLHGPATEQPAKVKGWALLMR